MPALIHWRLLARAFLALLALAAVLALGQPAHAGRIIYVTPGGSGNGSSWSRGQDLAPALLAAQSGDELWVKVGTYTPTNRTNPSDPRSATFMLKSGVSIYGGFRGNETSRDGRPPFGFSTTLPRGSLSLTTTLSGQSSNSYHVVKGGTALRTDVLDGLVITAGKANGASPDDSGGGLYADDGLPTLSNVAFFSNSAAGQGGGLYTSSNNAILRNVVFDTNSAGGGGGGMFNEGGYVALSDVTFRGNAGGSAPSPTVCQPSSNGGGLYVDNSDTVELTRVTFNSNCGANGGGLYSYLSSVALNRVIFQENTASQGGGGMANQTSNVVTVTNGIFGGNRAATGGALYTDNSNYSTLTNVTIAGNTASSSGGATYSSNWSTVTIVNSIVWRNGSGPVVNASGATTTVSYTDIGPDTTPYPGADGNINQDPKFAAGPPTSGAGAGAFLPFNARLQFLSPAINAGANAATEDTGVTTDFYGNPRIQDGIVDMGAAESRFVFTYVSPTVAPPGVNIIVTPLRGFAAGTVTPVRWSMVDTNGRPVNFERGMVAAVRYTSMTCGDPVPPYDDTYPMAGGFSASNPRSASGTSISSPGMALFNWQFPTAKGCYALFVQPANGLEALPFLFHIQ